MDFTISEKMQTILGMVTEFVQKELIPLELDFFSKPLAAMEPILQEKREMVKKMELWGPIHPTEYGGMGLNLMESALMY
jgi:alkylation response protein AidB-like acyl-CoA dehydrogenase